MSHRAEAEHSHSSVHIPRYIDGGNSPAASVSGLLQAGPGTLNASDDEYEKKA